jgi:hypothetical protein
MSVAYFLKDVIIGVVLNLNIKSNIKVGEKNI